MVTTIDFVQSDYNGNMPVFGTPGDYDRTLRFANKTATLTLNNTDYGYGVYSFGFTGQLDYVSICFLDPDGGNVSISSDQYSLYRISNSNGKFEFNLKNDSFNGPTTFYVVVNGDAAHKTERLSVLIAMGKRGTPPTTSSISITCDCQLPLYNYETGLHVYSPYDAIGSISKLKTVLSSFIPIESWTTNTPIYSGSFLQNPAAPYYYGYGTKVYKIGGKFDRSYGDQIQVTVSKGWGFKKRKYNSKTIGPQYWRSLVPETNQTSDACTMPLFEGVGRIRSIVESSTLIQPQQYRYYLGYNATNIRESSDSVFTEYNLRTNSSNPIVGSTHALSKILVGIVKGYDQGIQITGWMAAASALGLALLIPGVSATLSTVGASVFAFFDYLIGPFLPQAITAFFGPGSWLVVILGSPWFWVAVALFAIYMLVKPFNDTYREECKKFLHHFTDGPYIEVSTLGHDTILYRNPLLTIVNNGYYCDGVYYYQQSGGKIISKVVSSTNAIVNNNPVTFTFQYSLQADSPTTITDFNKLTVLSYTSGEPLPYCGTGTIYYNNESLSQIILSDCCDLQTGENTVIIIENGSEFSCISQQDANDKAQAAFTAAIDYAQNYANYCSPFDDSQLGILPVNFTHELKIEDIPTETTVYYNLSLGNVQIGTKFYYDNSGCQIALNGYYGVTGTTPYCIFYHTTNGAVDGIYVMENSNSTATTTGQPIITQNQEYSSNWFYSGTTLWYISYNTNIYENDRNFNANTLYSDVHMKKGFINNLTTLNDFQIYTDFVGTTHYEAPSGWYRPLVDWIYYDSFYYYHTQTMSLNIDEYCDGGTTRGFFITGILNNIPTVPANPVNMVINVYTDGIGLSGTYSVTTSSFRSSTFVNYGNQIGVGEVVSGITINSYISPNPFNKTTYTSGILTLCSQTSNTFRPTTNNLWSNPANWSLGHIPTSTERAVIADYCIVDINSAICDELAVNYGHILTFNNGGTGLQISGITNYGSITVTGSSSSLTMKGNDTKNTIWGNITFGNDGTMNLYNNTGTLTVPDLDYYNMVSGQPVLYFGNRLITTPMTIRGTLYTNKGVLLVTSDLTIDGPCVFGGENNGLQFSGCTVIFNGRTTSPNSDSIRFTDTIIYANDYFEFRGCSYSYFFFGSNTMYCKNGLSVTCGAPYDGSIDATGTDFIFTTNSQTISTYGIRMKSLTITGNITLTNDTIGFITTPILNGTTSTSTLVNKGVINYDGAIVPMLTGVLDCSSFVNTFRYTRNGNQSVLNGDYSNLSILGSSGNKELNGDTTVLNKLTVGATSTSGVLNLGTYNFEVIGNTDCLGASNVIVKSSAVGTTIFRGNFLMNNNGYPSFTNNCTIEFRGGIVSIYNNYNLRYFTGCIVKFTTNNQTVTNNSIRNDEGGIVFGTIIIDNITLTASNTHQFGVTEIQDTTSTSKLINKSIIQYNGSTIPMSTGILDCSGFTNTFNYNYIGNQTLSPVVYWNLGLYSLGTTRFVKTVTTDLTTLGNLYTQGEFTLELSSYDLTVNGTYTQGSYGPYGSLGSIIKKYESGNILFKGFYYTLYNNPIDVEANSPGIIFEFQGGALMDGYPQFKQCTMKWTTNNQNWTFQNEAKPRFDNLSILNGISITATSSNYGGLYVDNGITGTTGTSLTLTDEAQLFMSGETPFVTVILSGTINTKVSYIRNGNQTVNGGVYGSLTLGGITGSLAPNIKSVQGNVLVLKPGGFVIEGSASVLDNGYSITFTP